MRSLIKTDLDKVEYYNRAAENIPQFKGIKSELQYIMHIESHSPNQDPDLTFYIEGQELLSAAVYLRFDFFATSAANIFPRLVMQVMDYVQNGEMDKAKFKQKRLNALVTSIGLQGNLIATYKAAMEILTGIKFGIMQPPLEPLSDEGRKNIEEILNSNKDIKYVEY